MGFERQAHWLKLYDNLMTNNSQRPKKPNETLSPAILIMEWVLDLLQVCHSNEGRYKYDFIAFSSLGFLLGEKMRTKALFAL